ncbi:Rrf2 family transcriptional regulator [Tamaricihabitans halophyticus]
MSEGVEWAMHTCLNLAWVGADQAVPAARLAAFFELPAAYLNKQLQALVRAGIVRSVSGPRGGFRLARAPDEITPMDIVAAIEGTEEAFRCTQIVARSPRGDPTVDYRKGCAVARTMRKADLAWRAELAARSLADIQADVERHTPTIGQDIRGWFAA